MSNTNKNTNVIGDNNNTDINAHGNINITQGGTAPQAKEKEEEKKPAKRILVLSANPINTKGLRLNKEISTIEERLRLAIERKQIELKVQLAARFLDLHTTLLEFKPHIVHFIGHGEEDGILVEDNMGFAESVAPEILAELFETIKKNVECVIFGSCFSSSQAEAVSQYISYVIGVNQKIKDGAAIQFSMGFYNALSAGIAIEQAFKLGCISMKQSYPDLPATSIPILYKKKAPNS